MRKDFLAGCAVGAANGLFGGGGGMIAVPCLEKLGRAPKEAHATAIAVILPASALSCAVYLFQGLLPLALFFPVALGVLSGGVLGARLLGNLTGRTVTVLFSVLMLAAGVRLLF